MAGWEEHLKVEAILERLLIVAMWQDQVMKIPGKDWRNCLIIGLPLIFFCFCTSLDLQSGLIMSNLDLPFHSSLLIASVSLTYPRFCLHDRPGSAIVRQDHKQSFAIFHFPVTSCRLGAQTHQFILGMTAKMPPSSYTLWLA